jgi:hypothetical protein
MERRSVEECSREAAMENLDRVKGEDSEDQGAERDKAMDEQGYREGERKKGILRKLHLHKVHD